ncbi:MAG: sel1 repeat family protein [Proteobacteria bacterium]|nr:sel1 repeat family protein [Pseudomonadota bacterium]
MSNSPESTVLFQRACEQKSVAGCAHLAEIYAQGIGVVRDLERAAELHSIACSGNISHSCHSLGKMYRRGQGVEIDKRKARELAERAAALGEGQS